MSCIFHQKPTGYIRNRGEEVRSVLLHEHGVHLVRHRQLNPEEHLAPHREQLLGRVIKVVVFVVLIDPSVAKTGWAEKHMNAASGGKFQ